MADEVLCLSNKEMEGLFSREECIEAMEQAYLEDGRRLAKTIPRRRIYHPKAGAEEEDYYWFNEKAGLVPGFGTMAIRINSATVRVAEKRGNARQEFPGAFAGFSLLFDIDSNRPLAVIQDFYLNPIRVAAVSAIVTERLTMRGAKTMGVFGTGTQAFTQIGYTCAIRDLEEVRMYGTTKERREDAARRMDRRYDADVIAVDDPRDAVEGLDIVTTATNSNEPVFDGDWLEPGTHVNVVTPGNDWFLPRSEIDATTIDRSDLIVVNSKESIRLDSQRQTVPPEGIDSDRLYEIGDVLVGEIRGRTGSSQITCHANNVGMGIQFAAVGRLLYDAALEAGVGTWIDADIFMQYDQDLREVRDRGFVHRGDEPLA